MSAAEKLRANWTRLDVDRQVDAWPAIIAVVEAAEIVVDDFDIVYGPIVDALATLSQALEPGGSE